ncbi:MAG: DUF4860 domain-containing protein [Clostridia bacterium]|nr:DUF4860 domain-containing protein [Clostridia bacterium]
MKGKSVITQHSIQGVFVFVLLGLFAVMSTLMVLLGAQMYRATVERTGVNNEDRILSAYVRSMVRYGDAAGSVAVEDLDGLTVLSLYETIDDEAYVTRIYMYEGELYEQFTDFVDTFDPEDGTAICEVGGFEAALEGRLLTVDMLDMAGETCRVRVAVRCAS